jgi:hypothetical protein
MCFFVPEKGHPYPGLAMTGIVTVFKNLAKFVFNDDPYISSLLRREV